MRYLIALAPLALLAACGGNKAATNNASANTAATNTVAPAAAAPAANTAAPAAAPAAQAGQSRADLVAACVTQSAGSVPPGVDVNALCGCAIDQGLAGVGEEAAAAACAAQLGITDEE